MSLDVYLELEGPFPPEESLGEARERIFVRRNGSTEEISREEWGRLYPGRAPAVLNFPSDPARLYHKNITHNLTHMAQEAGLYEALWRPEENGITHARHLVGRLHDGLALLRSDPPRFKAFNPENGWGNYETLVAFVDDYLGACVTYPDARVVASR